MLAAGAMGCEPSACLSRRLRVRGRAGDPARARHAAALHDRISGAARHVNLRAMDTLRSASACRWAIPTTRWGSPSPSRPSALGAFVIEKHLTLDRNLPGPDHRASLEPASSRRWWRRFARSSRRSAAVEVKAAGGERSVRDVARRSLVALKPIKEGEAFSAENLGCKRPGTGASPFAYWSMLGQRAVRDYAADDLHRSVNP